ncbi:MAG TPA: ketosteroid isomerase [Chromatiaceae bacterium]|nr:MAG: hypothetical protein N838_20575 [Thiohalocapsa sp. PB-PSB1]QQO53834.1 MAG: SnoaL-like domain-containing protein [Thiohalocapsa sp. PB-PSB1]HBG94503.1 ketosteroid isomerase [Chromatiaceae bacterium]HCS88879.1 ketosteroid isomerase [Chromatiaceae bacterium]
MSQTFATPQQAEDAFYDALEERNDALMMCVWDDSPDIALLLPLQPFFHGGQVRNAIRELLRSDVPLNIQVRHLHWVEIGDLAIHYVEELTHASGPSADVPPLFATNIFRRRGNGWVMILHQNAPPSPPAGMSPH